mgnify:CR=1 FL=1
MTTRRYTKEETAEAIGRLLSGLTPGRTIFTKLTHVSRSGMSRSIECYLVQGRDNLTDITWQVARATNSRVDNTHGGIIMGGCGMDMGCYLVYNLGRTLYPNGVPCTGSRGYDPDTYATIQDPPRCKSNEHVNEATVPYSRDVTHRDGGYALNQVWR